MKLKIKGNGEKMLSFDVPECDGDGWTEEDRTLSQPFSAYEIEVFYYWYEFMRRSDRRYWTADVRQDFADVTKKDEEATLSFEEWWGQHSRLFRRRRQFDILELEEGMIDYFEPDVFQAENTTKAFVIDFTLPKDKLLKRLAQIIDSREKKHVVKGRYRYDTNFVTDHMQPGLDDGYCIYAPENARCKPRIRLLRNALEVYDMYEEIKRGELDIPYYLVEAELASRRGINDAIIKRRTKRVVEGKAKKVAMIEPSHETQAVTTARYKSYADRMIENVCKGFFPKYQK